MSGIAHNLIRRAVAVAQQHYNTPQGDNDDQIKQIAMWGMILIWVTGVLYFAMMSAISYTYGDVIATLTMIETPTATAFTVDSTDELDAPLLDQKPEDAKAIEADLFLVKQKPITSSMRSAIKHLKARGGRLARFRGFHVALIYHIALSVGTNFMTSLFGSPFGPWTRPLAFIVVSVVLARLNMTWTHIIISNPSEKRWYRRIVSGKAVRNIMIPTAVFAIAQLSLCLPVFIFSMASDTWQRPSTHGDEKEYAQKLGLFQVAIAVIAFIVILVFVVIPADVTLKRVQASMLPEQDEAIVPFDRTFGGKVVPAILGGSGAVSMFDAWKTFDRSARVRLIKLYAKIILVQVFTTVLFFMVVLGELRVIMGDDLRKAVRMGQEQLMR